MWKTVISKAAGVIVGIISTFLMYVLFALSSLGMYYGYHDIYALITGTTCMLTLIANVYIVFFIKKHFIYLLILQILSLIFLSLINTLSDAIISGLVLSYYDGSGIFITVVIEVVILLIVYKILHKK